MRRRRQAVEELPALRPDVVLMDIRMPALDGIAATERLRGAADPLAVLVLTTFGEDEVLWGAIEAGAAGFVLKDSSAEELIAAVRAVAGRRRLVRLRRSLRGCSIATGELVAPADARRGPTRPAHRP